MNVWRCLFFHTSRPPYFHTANEVSETILDQIVADTRALVAERQRKVPAGRLIERAEARPPTRSLAEALRRDGLAILAECKKASPSKGVIRADYDAAALAEQYAEAGADALSILTEPLHFQGSLDDLEAARDAVDLPLLRKDFILGDYQLFEARAAGADAVLLIAAVLDRHQLYDFQQIAAELGLACLVELYDIHELDRLDFDQVKILGVNNRDLRTFEVDIDHSLRVFAEAPEGVIRVSESGLRTAQDLAHLRRHGVDAVLIGETFMRAEHPGEALAALREQVLEILDQQGDYVDND